MINTKNLIMRDPTTGGSNDVEKKDKAKEKPKQTPDQAVKVETGIAKVDAKVTQQEIKADAQKSVEKQSEKGYVSSFDIMKGTTLDNKLKTELGSAEKVQEFVDRIDNVWYRAINNMVTGLDPKVAHNMATGINTYFIKMLDLSVKNGESKVEDVFGALKNLNFSAVSFDGVFSGMTGLFDKSTLLYNLVKNSTKIAKILRVNKKYIGDGHDIGVLNDPTKFMELLGNEKILALTDKDIYIGNYTPKAPSTTVDVAKKTTTEAQAGTEAAPTTNADQAIIGNAELKAIFAKNGEVKAGQNIPSNLKDIYENHGKVLSQESIKKVVSAMNTMADGADKVLPVMNKITTWIDNNGKSILGRIDGLLNNPTLVKLGLAGSFAGVKEFINTILGLFGRDYDSIVNADKQNFDIKENSEYTGSSFDRDKFLDLTDVYESEVGNLEGKCLKEVRKFMQALDKKGYINLPADIDKETWGGEAKEFGARLKNYASGNLPKDRSDRGIFTASLENKQNNPSDIYNTMNPMKGDMFNIVMTKKDGAGGSQAGHIAFGARVDNNIYIYDNSIKGEGDLDFVQGKNGFTLAKYIALTKGKYDFDAVMSIQSKDYKENNTEAVAETPESRKKYIFDYFKGKFDDDTAAAFVGNMAQETGETFDPKTIQASGGPGRGICQREKNGRFPDLENFAKTKGTTWDNLQTQLDFIVYELNGKEKDAAAKIKAASGVDAKTDAISKYYERAGSPDLVARRESANDAKESLA